MRNKFNIKNISIETLSAYKDSLGRLMNESYSEVDRVLIRQEINRVTDEILSRPVSEAGGDL